MIATTTTTDKTKATTTGKGTTGTELLQVKSSISLGQNLCAVFTPERIPETSAQYFLHARTRGHSIEHKTEANFSKFRGQ